MSNQIPEYLLKFVEDSKKELVLSNAGDNYCVILYAKREHSEINRAIYKNLDDFLERASSEIEKIDTCFGVGAKIWLFD